MLQITAIPLDDIVEYLSINHYPVSSDINDIYSDAFSLIYSSKSSKMTIPISDWIIANDLKSQNIILPVYTQSSILITPDNNLRALANELTLSYVDKERIIRILGYLGYLQDDMSIFNSLPIDMLKNIISYLNCKTIILICRLSSGFSNFCDLYLDNVLRENLTRTMKFDTRGYNRHQLLNLCKFSDKVTVTNISTSDNHLLIINKDGTVSGLGANTRGQLGNNKNPVKQLTVIPNITDIVQVCCGNNFSLLLNASGQIYLLDVYTPQILKFDNELVNIIFISCGKDHSLALTNNGQVYAFGVNIYGQLGLGDDIHRRDQVIIHGYDDVVKISCGSYHSLILLSNGQVYGFGHNKTGQLGLGDIDDRDNPVLISKLSNIVAISAGSSHSLALTENGQVFGFGDNYYGQLGIVAEYMITPVIISGLYNVSQILATYNFSQFLTSDDMLYGFGSTKFYERLTLMEFKTSSPTIIQGVKEILQMALSYKYMVIFEYDDNDNGFWQIYI